MPEYKALTSKRYRTPQGYRDYSDVALDMAAHCWGITTLNPGALNPEHSFAESIAYYLSGCLAAYKAPVYWLSEKLLEAILKTKLPEQIVVDHLQRPIMFATIMLPKGKIYTPDGEEISYLSFGHFLANEKMPDLKVNDKTIKSPGVPSSFKGRGERRGN